jgi:8-amino-7-oxononanoate synthase
MAPATAAAALESLKIMQLEPERVKRLRENTLFLLNAFKEAKIDVGNGVGYAIIPVITGSSMKAIKLSNFLLYHGVSVQSILYPAVEEKLARIRFFVSSEHNQEELIETVRVLLEGIKSC